MTGVFRRWGRHGLGRRGLGRRGLVLLATLTLLTACASKQSGDPQADPAASQPHSGSAAQDMPEDATSGEMIAAALESGEIDEPTSLLYRTWATFGDTALPEQYRGAPTPADPALIARLADGLDDLPSDIADQIEPFFKRPTDAASAFSGEGPDGLRAPGNALTAADAGPQRCADGWRFMAERDDDPIFKVWACNDIGDEAAVQDALMTAVELVEQVGGPIVEAMGRPLPDNPDADPNQAADELIDIYVLPPGWLAPYRDSSQKIGGTQQAMMPAQPRDRVASSAYGLLSSEVVHNPERWAGVVAQLLFSITQASHNWDLVGQSSWFYAASASWASAYFAPGSASLNRQVENMQNSALPVPFEDHHFHRYWAAVWVKFMQQQVGADSVFAVWDELASLPPGSGADDVIRAIEAQIDIDSEFAEFAMRLLNANLPGDPVTPRFIEVDETITDGTLPLVEPVTLGSDPVTIDLVGIPGMGYRYTHVTLADGGTAGVPVTLSGTAAGSAPLALEAVVASVDGQYTRQSVTVGGEMCAFGNDFWLVASNSSTDMAEVTDASITLEPTGATDGCGVGDAEPTSTPPGTSSSGMTASPSQPPPPAGASSCGDATRWDTAREEADIHLNAPIVSATGATSSCYDTIAIGLDSGAHDPGYVVEYVPDVMQQGTGHAVPVAGSHALSVIIDSPTADLSSPDYIPTIETSDDMVDVADLGAVRQVAHAGSFEGMTTFAIGVDGKQPFTVEAEPGRLVIKIARSGPGGTVGSSGGSSGSDSKGGTAGGTAGGTTANTPPPATSAAASTVKFCADWRDFSLRASGIVDLATLPYTLHDVDEISALANRHLGALSEDAANQVRVLLAFIEQGANLTAAEAAGMFDGPQVQQAIKSINAIYGTQCYDENGQPIDGR